MSEDESASESGLLSRQMTGEDRVRMAARQLSEPRTANWIASEANWSHEPTKRVLARLVDDGILHRDESGTHTTYYPDYRRQAMQEAMRLRDSGHTVEELTDRLAEMKARFGTGRTNSTLSHRTNSVGHSLTRRSTPTKRSIVAKSHASGSTSSVASRLSGSPSANGTSWHRRRNQMRRAANRCRSRILAVIRTQTSTRS